MTNTPPSDEHKRLGKALEDAGVCIIAKAEELGLRSSGTFIVLAVFDAFGPGLAVRACVPEAFRRDDGTGDTLLAVRALEERIADPARQSMDA